MNKTQYSYKLEGGLYSLYQGNQLCLTPKDQPVKVPNVKLAKKVIAELKAEADYSSAYNYLCHIYTWSDMLANDIVEKMRKEMKEYWKEAVFGDLFLMIGQDSPVKVAIATCYSEEIPDWLDTLNSLQLASVMCFSMCTGSIVLAYWYFDSLTDIDDQEDDIHEELMEYLQENFSDDKDEDEDQNDLSEYADHLYALLKVLSDCCLARLK